MTQYDFTGLKPGDKVRIRYLDERSFTGSNADESEINFEEVAYFYITRNFGPVLHTVDGNDYYSNDELEIEILAFNDTLPDTRFFTWTIDGEAHVAIRLTVSGDSWSYNSVEYSRQEMIAILGDARPVPLIPR